MQTTQEIEILKENVFSNDWKTMMQSVEKLLEIDPDNTIDFLVSLLDLDNQHNLQRNVAGVFLHDYNGRKEVIEPLLNAILKKQNINYNGTLVWALESKNCGYKFKEIFEILFYHGLVAKISAFTILNEQTFLFDRQDLIDIQAKWDDIQLHPEKSPEFEGSKKYIQDRVEAFTSYLNEKV